MTNLTKRVELLANIAIIVVALLLGVVLVNRFLRSPTISSERVTLSLGAKVPLTDTDWAKNGRTMVLVLSNQCHFCTESAPFYQRLVKERAALNNVRIVAVLPQTVSDGQQYLGKLGVTVDEIRQSPLSTMSVSGTPTLILADNTGSVSGTWVGKLPADKETEVLNRLRQQ